MTTSYPLATLAAQVTSAGIAAPAYNDILQSLYASFQSIYGSDVYLAPDSQDGQLLAIFAAAINDSNQTAIAVYNSFSPATAMGAGLSSVVKINGIAREVATNSTIDQVIVGVAGTVITGGVTQDTQGNLWTLPSPIVIPPSGTVTVTATCQTAGAITPAVGTVNIINTPTLGWQNVTNATTGSIGNPVEMDAALRVRQASSVSLPSLTVLAGLVGAVEAIPGVTQVVAYENDTATANSNGLPAHSISLVVAGGDSSQIASAISLKKTPGAATYGTTSQVVTDTLGIPHTINFFRPTVENVQVNITLHALTGYTATIGAEIQAAVTAYINNLAIGQSVLFSRIYVPANLSGSMDSLTYEITALTIGLSGGSQGTTDIAIAFNQTANCSAVNITVS